ncbi:MAG: hypothetical protein ACLUAR_16810 [Pilosibacter sp.]
MVENVLKDAYVPIALDVRDAPLNLSPRSTGNSPVILQKISTATPHMKENVAAHGNSDRGRSRKIRSVQRESLRDRHGVVCVLKRRGDRDRGKRRKDLCQWKRDARYAAGEVSGDALTGVIATGLIALGLEERTMQASLEVYVHGLAGEKAAKRFSVHAVLAGEIADCLSEDRENEI